MVGSSVCCRHPGLLTAGGGQPLARDADGPGEGGCSLRKERRGGAEVVLEAVLEPGGQQEEEYRLQSMSTGARLSL